MRYRGIVALAVVVLGVGVVVLRRGASTSLDPAARAQTVPAAAGRFVDVAARAGLTFRYENGHKGVATILEESGSGCAMLDFDGDGWLDLYLLNGRDLYGRGIRTRNALYRNNADGTFTDVTEQAGVPGTGYGIGVVAGDYDNDGRPDLYLCQWGKNVLYHNNGDGTFSDVTDRARVGGMDYGEYFHTGAAWLDYDRDGRLDLFVCGYVKFRQDGLRYCKLANGVRSNCPPQMYDGTPSILYRNNGDGTFANVTKKAGVYFPNGKALSAVTCDADEDGWTDLIVGNDGEEAWLLRNNRDGRFTNVASASGIAFAQDGATMAAMGIDLGDYRNEGRPGFFVADFSKRPDHLWQNLGRGFFSEVSTPAGIADPTFNLLGFGAGFFDCDNDGWLDLFVANGHVYPEVEHPGSDEHYLQPNQLFHNERDGTFRETTREAGPAFQLVHGGRGAAFGDTDNDGSVDILVNNNDGYAPGPPVFLHNGGSPGAHFLSLRLAGTKSNRDAVGARVWVTAGSLRQMRDVKSGGSYLSSSDPRLHFGLGSVGAVREPPLPASSKGEGGSRTAPTADPASIRVEVRWPSGLRQKFGPLAPDQFYVLREGAATPELQAFRPPRRGAGG